MPAYDDMQSGPCTDGIVAGQSGEHGCQVGASAKTLERLMQITEAGHLPAGAQICDIGTTQLFGPFAFEAAQQFLAYYAKRKSGGAPPEDVADEQLRGISEGGLLGDLLALAGFGYVALDIFRADRTILFDLNIHTPGPKLSGRFDLVMNLGTTEHVFNQTAAFRTIHILSKPNGLIYHDLPLGGFLNHAFFRYDPLFFRCLVMANDYRIVQQQISTGAEQQVSEDMRAIGFSDRSLKDFGIEMVLQKTSDAPFYVPLERSTSLAIEPFPADAVDNETVALAGEQIDYREEPKAPTGSSRSRRFLKNMSSWVMK